MKSATALSFVLFLFVFSSCVQKPKPVLTPGYQPPVGSITLMTFNLENLFDTENDPGKHDESFLPLKNKGETVKAACRVSNETNNYRLKECFTKNWDERVLKMKMKRLTDVVKQVKNGRGPDILIMQEVENLRVLEIWRTQYLADMGYHPALLLEGPDERGIDVGIFTRLEVLGPINLHLIPFKANEQLKDVRPSRGILEANLKLPDGTPLTVFGVHFPAQAGPTETRRQALDFVDQLKSKLPPDRLVVVGGDFNISRDEDYKTGLLSDKMAKNWGISFKLGCNDCKGTHYYGRDQSWSTFDVFLISQGLLEEGKSPWKLIPESIRIENKSVYQTNRFGAPARFDENRKDGVSDHWPVAMEIMKR
jgi:endonuclease/exonuclease/phosphatase family metal-dependent hydrolase